MRPDFCFSMEKVKNNSLSSSDMEDPTITISNFGAIGGLLNIPILNYHEACSIGIGKMEKQPVVKDNDIVIRDMMFCSWSLDHRIIGGAIAAEFSNFFFTLLENPETLL